MSAFDLSKTVGVIQSVVPQTNNGFVALHEPCFQGNEWQYVKECLDTGWVSSVGKFVDGFEERLAQTTGVKRAVAVVNGTAALHVCLQLCGVQSGDEVMIPSLTFVATANAIAYCGAIPHFIDSEERTLGIDAGKLAEYLAEIADMRSGSCFNRLTGRRVAAVMPMHTFGHPVELDALAELCDNYGLPLIEDAAEALGSLYRGRHVGHHGRCAALSFNGNKVITTGGGGAILTNDDDLADAAKHLTTTAKVPHRWAFFHDQIAYNYRLPNLNAALGCAQLEQLPGFLESKRALAARYAAGFKDVSGIRFFLEPAESRSNYWLNALVLDRGNEDFLEPLLEATNGSGLMTRPVWTPLHQLPMYTCAPRMNLDTAESLAQRLINIPSSSQLAGKIEPEN